MSIEPTQLPSREQALFNEFRYPSVDPGIPVFDIDALLTAHRELIDRIKLCFGMDRAAFEQSVVPLLRRYAAYVHLLPCTADNYFNAPGGLLRIGLETAFYALQGTDAHIFSGRATITERHYLEPRWRQATFIAGLCSELHRPLSHFIVTDEAGSEWPPYLRPLTDWLAEHQIKRYFIKWRPNAHESRSLGLFALPHVVSADVLQDLSAGNAQIVPHLLATIAGIPLHRDHNVLEALVRRALALVIDRFLQANAERYGKPQLGSHLERYLVDALRRLVVANASWIPNADKSRVWYGSDGMFIVWPSAADDVRKLLETDQLPGIPKAPETILEILLTAGVLAPQEAGAATWLIYPPGSKTALEAVKLSAPAILYAESDKLPDALPTPLLNPTTTPSRPPSSPAAASPVTKAPVAPTGKGRARTQATASAGSPVGLTPEQLPLLEPASAAATEHGPSAPLGGPLAEAQPDLPDTAIPTLQAPLRLPVAIRDALQEIVATLSCSQAEWAAQPMDGGLFVPLAAFATRKVAPPAAIRALTETGMLAQETTLTRPFQGQDMLGVLLSALHVRELPSTFPGGDH